MPAVMRKKNFPIETILYNIFKTATTKTLIKIILKGTLPLMTLKPPLHFLRAVICLLLLTFKMMQLSHCFEKSSDTKFIRIPTEVF